MGLVFFIKKISIPNRYFLWLNEIKMTFYATLFKKEVGWVIN